jgi:predicted nucleic acid-binding protein
MTKSQLLFDSNSIYKLIREHPQDAVEKIAKGTTIYLAYYELGNALWRECLLLKRISIEEAEKSLDLMYSILERIEVASLDSETGSKVLDTAYKFNLTFYDSAYLVEAKKNNKILVTDDNKLAKVAENFGIETLSSNRLVNSHE